MFSYNEKAFYAPYSKHQELITGKDLSELSIVVQDDGKTSDGFVIKLPDELFDLGVCKYTRDGDFYDGGGFQTARSSYNFQHEPMKLWETQLNLAVHCATSALGVCTKHLNSKMPMVRSVYRFHAYYHIRRVLKRMMVPLPSEDGFDKYSNSFNLAEINRIGERIRLQHQ